MRRTEFVAWSNEGVAPRKQAVNNLANASKRARFLEHDTPHGPIVMAQSRDGLDAARLLLPGLYDVLAQSLGTPFLAATPHRDTLLASPTGPRALVEELKSRVDAAARSSRQSISDQLWLVTGPGQWRPIPVYDEHDFEDDDQLD